MSLTKHKSDNQSKNHQIAQVIDGLAFMPFIIILPNRRNWVITLTIPQFSHMLNFVHS